MPLAKRKATASPPPTASVSPAAAGVSEHDVADLEIDAPTQIDEVQRPLKRPNLKVTANSELCTLPLDTLEQLLPLQKRRCLDTLVGSLPPTPASTSLVPEPTKSAAQLEAEEDAAVFTNENRQQERRRDETTRLQAAACVGLAEEWYTLHKMLHATVTAQESNSALLIGASGSGKSMLVDTVLASLTQESRSSKSNDKPYYHVHLAGTVQINDRSAMKEMAQQLILQGAFTEQDVGEAMDAEALDEDEQDATPSRIAADHVFGGDGEEEDDDEQITTDAMADEEAEIQDELAGAILSSLNNIIAHIIALLSNTASSEASNAESASGGRKPLIITLDDFDLFTARPRQAMLYCLLDAVQAASYGAGLAVVGLTSRVDTVDLLEKRVKSRFSHRILHVRPPSSYEFFERIVQNALAPVSHHPDTSSISTRAYAEFTQAWEKEVTTLFSNPHFRDVLHGIYELSNDIRMVYRVLTPAIARLSVLEPAFDVESLLETASVEVGDGMLHVLRDLTEPEMALLIAVKQLQIRDRQIFNFEMCFDELRRFAARDARERQAASTGAALMSATNSTTTTTMDSALSGSAISTPFYADRKIALMSFHSLLNLEILLPENYVSTLTIANPVAKPSAAPYASTGRANQNTIRKEFWKVTSILTPTLVVQAVKDRHRQIPINSSLVKWATSHG